jgi:hypothetical protein
MVNRSFSVTVICILGWLVAILSFLGGLASTGIIRTTSLSGTFLKFIEVLVNVSILTSIVILLGPLNLAFSALNVIAFYWLWKMKKRGWLFTMVLQGTSIVIGIIQAIYVPLTIFGIVIPSIIIIFLWKNKKLFK